MRTLTLLLCLAAVGGAVSACSSWGPVSARQREQAQYDTPRDHPHPPAIPIGNTAADPSYEPLRCWNNAPEIVCSRTP